MRRLVRFRAKPIENDSIDKQLQVTGKDWIYGGGAISLPNGKYAFIHLDDNNRLTVTLIAIDTLCQWTGRYDKDGDKIYEGDIVKVQDDTRLNGSVQFHDAAFIVVTQGYQNRVLSAALRKDSIGLEIIGNIHEHPDLLT